MNIPSSGKILARIFPENCIYVEGKDYDEFDDDRMLPVAHVDESRQMFYNRLRALDGAEFGAMVNKMARACR